MNPYRIRAIPRERPKLAAALPILGRLLDAALPWALLIAGLAWGLGMVGWPK